VRVFFVLDILIGRKFWKPFWCCKGLYIHLLVQMLMIDDIGYGRQTLWSYKLDNIPRVRLYGGMVR
jgi:hypothetical protein